MKCSNCGAEIKVGSLYCASCGKEAQLVPDYNILEDDVLRKLLEEENQQSKAAGPKAQNTTRAAASTSAQRNRTHTALVRPKRKKSVSIILAIVVLLVLGGCALGVKCKIDYDHAHSYSYQYALGQEAEAAKDLDRAVGYYKNALNLNNEDLDVRFALAKLYETQEDITSAIEILQEIIIYDEENVEAYQELIRLMDEQQDYDSILSLKEQAVDKDEVNVLFSDYEVAAPEFSMEEGTYNEEIEVGLEAAVGVDIYYTTDGSSPVTYGTLYTDKILLDTEEDTTITAVAKDERGIYSEISSAIYIIDFQAPARASVIPGSGTITTPESIVISVPDGCSAYYTWDGTTPTANSEEYTVPLAMPAGNNVLSVILIDSHGLSSNVARYNYIYLP